MGRWKQAKQCIIDVGLVGRGANYATTTLIVANHNADCDAYEEKIAELQRRLDEVVEWVQQTADLGEVDAHTLAIAEGRTE